MFDTESIDSGGEMFDTESIGGLLWTRENSHANAVTVRPYDAPSPPSLRRDIELYVYGGTFH